LERLEKLAKLRKEHGLDDDVDEDEAVDELSAREWVVGTLLDALAAVPSDLVQRAFVDNGILGGSTVKVASQLYNVKGEH